MRRFLSFKYIARALTAASLGFLVWMVATSELWSLLQNLDAQALPVLVVAVGALTLHWIFPGLAWALMARRLAPDPVLSLADHLILFATTQIQKYLPGNVFHFIIRHLKARHRGEADGPLFWACVGELIGQMVAAGLLAGMTLGLAAADFALAPLVGLMILLGAITFVGLRVLQDLLPRLVDILVRLVGSRGRQWYDGVDLEHSPLNPSVLATALPFYVFYIGTLGTVAWSLSHLVAPALPLTLLPFVIGWTAIAWTVGFVLPGAPGGLGAREAVLTAALVTVTTPENALVIALGLRLCTVLSDVFFFAGGSAAHLIQSRLGADGAQISGE